MIRVLNHWAAWRLHFPIASFVFAFILVVVATVAIRVSTGQPVDIWMVAVYALILALTTLLLNTILVALYQRMGHWAIYQSIGGSAIALLLAVPLAYVIFHMLPVQGRAPNLLELAAMAGVLGLITLRIGADYSKSAPIVRNRVLVYGVGARALMVKKALEKAGPTVKITGYYPCTPDEKIEVPHHRVLRRDQSLTDVVKILRADEIVVAVTDQRGGVLPMRELLDCKLHGVRVYDLAAYFEQMLGQIRLDALRAGWLIFGDGFRQDAWRTLSKRVFDIVFASILLVLASPVMLLTAFLIALESGYPILYRQERVGENGRLFNVIKFRSMRTDAEKDGKPRWAKAGDSRITRVGRVIRKLRIDELPQLFNVLFGQMSLVGPRPERPYFVDQLTAKIPYYAVRHSVKPGVTGWAQVRYHYGGSIEGASEKLQYDLYYVKNHTLLLDLMILFETVGVVLTGKGAQ